MQHVHVICRSLEPGSSWSSIGCTLVYHDIMYHIYDNLFELDLFNWQTTDFGEVPSYARRPGRCAVATVERVPGKYNNLLFAVLMYDYSRISI